VTHIAASPSEAAQREGERSDDESLLRPRPRGRAESGGWRQGVAGPETARYDTGHLPPEIPGPVTARCASRGCRQVFGLVDRKLALRLLTVASQGPLPQCD